MISGAFCPLPEFENSVALLPLPWCSEVLDSAFLRVFCSAAAQIQGWFPTQRKTRLGIDVVIFLEQGLQGFSSPHLCHGCACRSEDVWVRAVNVSLLCSFIISGLFLPHTIAFWVLCIQRSVSFWSCKWFWKDFPDIVSVYIGKILPRTYPSSQMDFGRSTVPHYRPRFVTWTKWFQRRYFSVA